MPQIKNTLKILLVLLLISCNYNPDKRSVITIRKIENSSVSSAGKYKYTLHTTFTSMGNTYLYSDEVYKLNDTLQIKK